MSDERTCEHPQERIEVEELELQDDGTPVLRARCTGCGLVVTEPLSVTYTPRPVGVGGRWLPMVKERGNLAVCSCCGRPLFPVLHLAPLVLFCRDDAGEVVGEVDVCWRCEVDEDVVEVLTHVFSRLEAAEAVR